MQNKAKLDYRMNLINKINFKRYSIGTVLTMAAAVSFLGFVIEDIWLALTRGYINNRNMTIPFLFGYGIAVIAIAFFVGTPQKYSLKALDRLFKSQHSRIIVYYCISFIVVTMGEEITGTTFRRVFGFDYWSYRNIPFHITKYTTFITSTGFALGVTAFMGIFYTPMMNLIEKIPKKVSIPLGTVLFIITFTDFIYSFIKMYVTGTYNILWKFEVPPILSILQVQ